jgi:hypothetical protein
VPTRIGGFIPRRATVEPRLVDGGQHTNADRL